MRQLGLQSELHARSSTKYSVHPSQGEALQGDKTLLCFSLATYVAVVFQSDSFCDDVTDSCELE